MFCLFQIKNVKYAEFVVPKSEHGVLTICVTLDYASEIASNHSTRG